MASDRGPESTARAGDGAALSDAQLVAALRRGETRVLGEFVYRFQRVVFGQAMRYHIPPAERRGWALDLLHDVALGLMRRDVPAPRAIRAYLARAAHHRWVDGCRVRERERRRRDVHSARDWSAEDGAAAGGSSAYSLRASRGPYAEEAPLAPALERLAEAMLGELAEDERQLLSWVSRDVPHHEIASALGLTRSAVSQRVRRLRARLVDVAGRYLHDAGARERAELRRFLRRAEVELADGPARSAT